MFKWASLMFDTVAILGWIMIVVLIIDAVVNNSKLVMEVMANI